MAYILDKTGTLHKGTGPCEECGEPGHYVRAVRICGWERSAAIYACNTHHDDATYTEH
ncbi:hypothetical protein [Streptomyces sp. 039-1]|uniref:hypothetical protein n=1 Tax=Streptomyces sp. 039-1 TaxID=2789263 RepID=UPI0039F60636